MLFGEALPAFVMEEPFGIIASRPRAATFESNDPTMLT